MTIEEGVNKGYYIDIIADGYKSFKTPCWRTIVHYKEKGKWIYEDCGCHMNRRESKKLALDFIRWHSARRKS